jgi:beta-ureidopropionase
LLPAGGVRAISWWALPPFADAEDIAMILRAALLQATWTGSKESMVEKHLRYVADAARQGAQLVCFQELFFAPFFCQVQDARHYAWAEAVPGGPTTQVMMEAAKKYGTVLVVPMHEEESPGVYYSTAAVIDADGRYLGKYRKTHIAQVTGFWEKFYFRPGNLGFPVFLSTLGFRLGVYVGYDRHFPEGARMLGLHGAELVLMPSATSRGLSQHLWKMEQTSHAIANGYYVGTVNRVGVEEEFGPNDYYGQSYFCTPRGELVGAMADAHKEELLVRDLDLDLIRTVRNTWQFYRDRRPEIYTDVCCP